MDGLGSGLLPRSLVAAFSFSGLDLPFLLEAAGGQGLFVLSSQCGVWRPLRVGVGSGASLSCLLSGYVDSTLNNCAGSSVAAALLRVCAFGYCGVPHSPGWHQTHSVVQDDPELLLLHLLSIGLCSEHTCLVVHTSACPSTFLLKSLFLPW